MSWMNLEEWCWLKNLVLQTYAHGISEIILELKGNH